MASPNNHSDFKWLPEYDQLLEKIASTDVIDAESDWTILRDIIKCKIEKNIGLFISESHEPSPPPVFSPEPSTMGGFKLPPFAPRNMATIGMVETPVSYMTERQANEMKEYIFAQIHEFDSNPPFTIQRVCELCISPKQHYKTVGKYLRAVERSLLVTSTWDSFPPLSETETDPPVRSVLTMGLTGQSVPSTPLFSPIPFLHDDARRSKSRSPPPSPLALSTAGPGNPEALEAKALGLVDELDDPSPGHMSDHPTALTSVTTVGAGKGTRPIIGSLEQRFVKSEEGPAETSQQSAGNSMVLDDNKENSKS